MECACFMGRAAACEAVTPFRISRRESPCQASPEKARRSWSAMRAVSDIENTPFVNLLALAGKNAYMRQIGGLDDIITVNQQTPSCVDSETARARLLHDFNRLDSNHR